jgi:short-subunit dehydrogenase
MSLGLSAAALTLSSIEKPYSFKGRVALITGGSRGLGLALAKRLVREGAMVSILARDAKELLRAKNILTTYAPEDRVMIYECDITDENQLSAAFEKTISRFGDIDVLINNAGSILVGPFESMLMEDFEAQMKLHLYANISATQKILPVFRRKRDGRIINICSMGGKVAVPHMLPYDSSKFALAGFSQGIAAELAKENIAVTTVYPTLMRTGSPIQAVFKGDAKKEFAWFANADVFPGFSMAAEEAADKIIEASRERKSEFYPSLIGKFRMTVGHFFPELMIFMMGVMNRLMPNGKSYLYRTGAQCLADDSYLTSGLRQSASRAEGELNQEQKSNPEFNIGLH